MPSRAVKVTGFVLLGAATAALIGVVLARDQMVRHRRGLFSPHPLRRLAALGYLRSYPNVDNVLLLRDYLAWEQRPMLRKKASAVLEDMERELTGPRMAEGT
ncbi:MAG: hypothetical protein V3W24_03655 [Gemmatimonadota bacterium]